MTRREELSKLKTQHQLILDAAGEGIYGLDREGRITFSNAAAAEILGWKLEDVHGKKAHDVHHHSHADGSPYPQDDCLIYAALRDGEVHRVAGLWEAARIQWDWCGRQRWWNLCGESPLVPAEGGEICWSWRQWLEGCWGGCGSLRRIEQHRYIAAASAWRDEYNRFSGNS